MKAEAEQADPGGSRRAAETERDIPSKERPESLRAEPEGVSDRKGQDREST